MMTILIVLAAAAQAYLLGSIDTGILVSKYLYHDDVRNYGSGAAGMTNMLRTFGKKAAALTAAGDVLKGVAAVCIGRWLFGFLPENAAVSPYLGVYLTAILAVVGHLKPLYFGFKGGKGVLVAGGAILAIQPILLPFLAAIFLLCLLLQFLIACFSCFQICQCFRILLLEDLLLRIRQCIIRCTGGFNGSLALKRDIFRQANILDCLICLLCGISICKFFFDLSALCNCGFELFGIC